MTGSGVDKSMLTGSGVDKSMLADSWGDKSMSLGVDRVVTSIC